MVDYFRCDYCGEVHTIDHLQEVLVTSMESDDGTQRTFSYTMDPWCANQQRDNEANGTVVLV